MESGERPVLLGQGHIQRALADDRFYGMLPEFLPIRKKIEASHADVGTSCTPCRRRRMAVSFSSDFVSILNSLSQDGLARLKKYLGVGRLLVRAMDRTAGRTVLKEV